VVELLRSRYRVTAPPQSLYGYSYEQVAMFRATRGTDELVRLLVDRLREPCRDCDAVLVLGTDFSSGTIPDEVAFNAPRRRVRRAAAADHRRMPPRG